MKHYDAHVWTNEGVYTAYNLRYKRLATQWLSAMRKHVKVRHWSITTWDKGMPVKEVQGGRA